MPEQYTQQISSRARQQEFSDIDFHFTPNINTGDVVIQKDTDAIRQSLINILTTNRGERPFVPTFGANLYAYPLFENFTSITRASLRQDIIFAIENWEPRVRVNDVEFDEEPNRYRLKIRIHYTIISPIGQDTSLEFIVNRVR